VPKTAVVLLIVTFQPLESFATVPPRAVITSSAAKSVCVPWWAIDTGLSPAGVRSVAC